MCPPPVTAGSVVTCWAPGEEWGFLWATCGCSLMAKMSSHPPQSSPLVPRAPECRSSTVQAGVLFCIVSAPPSFPPCPAPSPSLWCPRMGLQGRQGSLYLFLQYAAGSNMENEGPAPSAPISGRLGLLAKEPRKPHLLAARINPERGACLRGDRSKGDTEKIHLVVHQANASRSCASPLGQLKMRPLGPTA